MEDDKLERISANIGDIKDLISDNLGNIKVLLQSILDEMKQKNHYNMLDQDRPIENEKEDIIGEKKLQEHLPSSSAPAPSIRPSSSVLVNKQQELISQAASFGDDKNNNKSSFDQFVVVDLMATCWDRDENKYGLLRQEIVEFSSVLVDAATGDTKSTFHKYVIPTENHVLSEYCKNNNGIEQEAVERHNGAVTLSEALHLHQEWIGKLTNWNSATAVVVTWGNWDCRTMLKQECFRKNLPIPDYFARWINLKTPFADNYGNGYWKKTVKEALEATEVLEWEGAIEGGESHAHNKARLLSLLIHLGANLAITSWLDPAAAAPNN